MGTLDRAEHEAESIYEKLRFKFPKSTKVLRQFAIFLEEVKHDPQQAQIMYATADLLEENQVTSLLKIIINSFRLELIVFAMKRE